MARPPRPIDYAVVEKLAFIDATEREIAIFLGFTEDHFTRRKKRDAELCLALEKGRENGKLSLRRWQSRRAQAGSDTMLIWLGKQRLGQRDKNETEHKLDSPLEELVRRFVEKTTAGGN